MTRRNTPVGPERGAVQCPDISPEALDAAMRRGRKLRARHAAALVGAAVALAARAATRLRARVAATRATALRQPR